MDKTEQRGAFFAEVVFLYVCSFGAGYMLFLISGAAWMAIDGRGESLIIAFFVAFAFLLIISLLSAMLAIWPAALIFVPSFYVLFHLLMRLVGPRIAGVISAGCCGCLAMLFAKHVNIELSLPSMSFETDTDFNLVPNFAGLVWAAMVASMGVAYFARPGCDIFGQNSDLGRPNNGQS